MKTSTNKFQIGQTVHVQGIGIAIIAGKTRLGYIIESPVDWYHYFCKEKELRKVRKTYFTDRIFQRLRKGQKSVERLSESLRKTGQTGIQLAESIEDFAKAIYEEITPEQAEINAKIMQK